MHATAIEGRDVRQRDLVPPERLSQTGVTVIGCGAVGRQAALQLAALGVSDLQLVDFDTVEAANLAPQGFLAGDLGRAKVAAVAEQCQAINPAVRIELVQRRFNRSLRRTPAVFCCVDRIAARKRIYEQVRETASLFLDARMSAEVIRVLSVASGRQGEAYLQTCFATEQAYAGACTAKSTIYTASIAAGLQLAQFTRWLRRLPTDRDVQLNLLTMEIGIA